MDAFIETILTKSIEEFVSSVNDKDKVAFLSDIFQIIEYIFSNPERVVYLEEIYKACNRTNNKLLSNAKNTQGKSLKEVYEDYGTQTEQRLEKHRCEFIQSISRLSNMLALFYTAPTAEVRKIPTNAELLDRIETLEREVSQLKVRITNENLLASGGATEETTH